MTNLTDQLNEPIQAERKFIQAEYRRERDELLAEKKILQMSVERLQDELYAEQRKRLVENCKLELLVERLREELSVERLKATHGLDSYYRNLAERLQSDTSRNCTDDNLSLPLDIFVMRVLPHCDIRTRMRIGATSRRCNKIYKETLTKQEKFMLTLVRKQHDHKKSLREQLISGVNYIVEEMLDRAASSDRDQMTQILDKWDDFERIITEDPEVCAECKICNCSECRKWFSKEGDGCADQSVEYHQCEKCSKEYLWHGDVYVDCGFAIFRRYYDPDEIENFDMNYLLATSSNYFFNNSFEIGSQGLHVTLVSADVIEFNK
ncbi:hypothetical protein DFS34DRAFT_618370 [Phlyctochytrium arcticum]|nr:hypothetical protein DFS34DRAFT_618370 [Phlyctochytrium arcticum]